MAFVDDISEYYRQLLSSQKHTLRHTNPSTGRTQCYKMHLLENSCKCVPPYCEYRQTMDNKPIDKPPQPMPQSLSPAKPISAANAKQIAGDHYKKYGALQPWDVVVQWNMGYLDGTALKYIARWKDKGGVNDLKKAIHFLEKLIEVTEQSEAANRKVFNNPSI